MTQAQLDAAFLAFAAEVNMVMDSDADREDFATHGHLYADPGSDVHDFEGRP